MDSTNSSLISHSSDLNPSFQAVGVIYGIIHNEEDKYFVTLNSGLIFPLRWSFKRNAVFKMVAKLHCVLQKTQSKKELKLLVYPKVIHLPGKENLPKLHFELVGFTSFSSTQNKEKDAFEELNDLEFKLSGLWQFIPVCRTPCISVFKNFTEERKQFIKEAETITKVKFMKPTHVPLLWRDSSVAPFRFNKNLPKEENGQPKFVQIKAKFIPHKNCFGFVEELSEPIEEIPRYLKASKTDKAQVQNEKKNTVSQELLVEEKKEEKLEKKPTKIFLTRTVEKPKLIKKVREENKS